MGSPLGPIMANTFMCSLEEQLKLRDKLPSYYKRNLFPGVSHLPEERPWFGLVTCLPDFSRFHRCD